MISFIDFLRWEKTTKDTIDFKKIYVDMAKGDPIAGLALSSIVYWHLPDRHGKNKMRVFRDGYWWIAKARDEWWDECRLTPKRVDRAIAILRDDTQLVATQIYKFGHKGHPTLHVRILEDKFLAAWEQHLGLVPISNEPPPPEPDSPDQESEGDSVIDERGRRNFPAADSGAPFLPDWEQPNSQSGKNLGSSLSGNNDIPDPVTSSTENSKQSSPVGTCNVHQQQAASAAEAVVVPSANASDKTASECLLENLLAFQTGLGSKFIAAQIDMHPEHCARVAECWPELDECKAEFWENRKGTPAGALRLRLADPEWLPPKEYGIKQAAAKRAERKAAEAEEAERAAAKLQEDAESMALRTKDAWGNLQRFEALSGEQRKAVTAEIIKCPETQFVGELVEKRGGFSRIEKGSKLWIEFLEAVKFLTPRVLQAHPALPELQRGAAGEEDEDAPEVEAKDEPAHVAKAREFQEFIEYTTRSYADIIIAGQMKIEQLDEERQYIDATMKDSQWSTIVEGVKKLVREAGEVE